MDANKLDDRQKSSAAVIPNDDVPSETTRIFVSNLPPAFTSEQLASHIRSEKKFAKCVTDTHVVADRRIGFVGFTNTAAAQDAQKYFNKSYIRMSKISAELARPVEVRRAQHGQAVPVSQKENISSKRKRAVRDDGERERLRAEQDQKELEEKLKKQRKVPEQVQTPPDSQEEEELEELQANDNDWLRGKTTRTLDLVDADSLQIDNTAMPSEPGNDFEAFDQNDRPDTTASEGNVDHIPAIEVPNARLFLRNLAFSVNEPSLREYFAPFGKIQEIHLVKDSKTSTSKGTAFVQFSEPFEAEEALVKLDGTTLQGRLLHILPASNKRQQGLTEFDISQMPLKQQKAIRRKQEASKASFSWNSLYMNPDAVLSSIADRLGVAKADILDPTSADAAVKQALAETQLIQETKQYLASAGVNVDAFRADQRDDRCILLKNFPYGTTESELRALLEKNGEVEKFILPPSGTMAIVQFQEPHQATDAIKGLAYKSIKGSILYLERAPQGILSPSTKTVQPVADKAGTNEPDSTNLGTTSTVFVKNLNFSTTSKRLSDIAADLPGFVTARVKTRTDPKRPGEVLSMGFGFIEFRTKSQAESAVGTLSGHQLDGHQLIAQISSKASDAAESTRAADKQKKTNANRTKIIIKNLPFQTSKKDIRSLFAQYGELKMVRVPKKFDNTARGFAFAEFITPKEAENAMDALENTHLLGRRLVLQFAEGDDIDPEDQIRAIEKKLEHQSNRVQFNKLRGTGRKKFNVNDPDDDDGME